MNIDERTLYHMISTRDDMIRNHEKEWLKARVRKREFTEKDVERFYHDVEWFHLPYPHIDLKEGKLIVPACMAGNGVYQYGKKAVKPNWSKYPELADVSWCQLMSCGECCGCGDW